MNISETNRTSLINLNTQGSFILLVSSVINLILSVPTNVYILWLILNGPGRKMASEFFALNLAVSEILFCLFSVFFIVNTPIQRAVLSDLGTFSLGILFTGRPLFQCCICVERYLAVVHPVTFLKYKPLRYRVGFCGAAWLLVFGGGLYCTFQSKTLAYNYVVFVQNLILMIVMLFCGLSVLRVLKQPGPGEGYREGEPNIRMRAFKIISIILVLMLLSYSPLFVNVNLFFFIEPVTWFFTYSIIYSISMITGFVQPLLYLHRAGKLPCIRAL